VEHLVNFVQKKVQTTLEEKKTDFSEKFQTRKKLDSESTDFFSDFFKSFENVANIIPFFNAIELHFQFFTKTFRKIERNSPQKKTVESILPKLSFSNSGLAYPPNQRFCFGGNFPKFRP